MFGPLLKLIWALCFSPSSSINKPSFKVHGPAIMGHIKGLISCNFGRQISIIEELSFLPLRESWNTCVWRAKCLPYSRCLVYVDSSRIGVYLLHRTPPCVIIFEWLCLVVGLGFWSSYNLVLDATRHPWSYWCCLLGFNHQTIIFFHLSFNFRTYFNLWSLDRLIVYQGLYQLVSEPIGLHWATKRLDQP